MSKYSKNKNKSKENIDDWSDAANKNEIIKPEVADSTKNVWSNDLVTPVSKVTIHVPEAISLVMRTLHNKYEDVEFSILSNSSFDKEQNVFVLSEEFYIPKQKVSRTSIHYSEDMSHEYNTVIHKHPKGCTNFSSQDDQSINVNFSFSLLWLDFEFIKGICNLDTPYGNLRVRLPLEVIELYSCMELEESLMNKIEKETTTVFGGNGGSVHKQNFPHSHYYGGSYGFQNGVRNDSVRNSYLKDMINNSKPYELNNSYCYVDSEGNEYRESDFDDIEMLPGSALATMDDLEKE